MRAGTPPSGVDYVGRERNRERAHRPEARAAKCSVRAGTNVLQAKAESGRDGSPRVGVSVRV